MNRTLRATLAALLVVAVSTVGAAGPAPAAGATATAPPSCTDPRNGVTFTATIVGTEGDDVIWATPGSVVATLGGDDSVFTDYASPNVIVCLDDGADYFGPSVPDNVIAGGFGVQGGAGRDVMMGGGGNDYLLGGLGSDIHLGGPGNDRGDAGEDPSGLDADLCDVETSVNDACEFAGVDTSAVS